MQVLYGWLEFLGGVVAFVVVGIAVWWLCASFSVCVETVDGKVRRGLRRRAVLRRLADDQIRASRP